MPVSAIYAITDPLLPEPRLFAAVEQALHGGLRLLQYRDKHATADQRLARATQLLALCRANGATLIINDHAQLAADIGADGVHLGQSDGNVAHARNLLGRDAIIGVTCHASLELARDAVQAGASYVAFGRFFPSHTKPGAPGAPPGLLGAAQAELPVPLVGIGGVDASNMLALKAAGADAVALCHSLFAAVDVRSAARHLLNTWNQHHV